MSDWRLVYDGFDPATEGLREALCTLGNGFFATRGAAAESRADDVHYPGTYIAGCYDRLVTEVAGRDVENEDLVNVPNWLPLTFRVAGGDWFDPGALDLIDYRQELDVRRGLLARTVRARDGEGRVTSVTERRFVHMARPHLAAMETTIVPENWSGAIEVRSALDGTVTNSGVARYRSLRGDHLVPVDQGESGKDQIHLEVQTRQSKMFIALAARTRVTFDGDHTVDGASAVVEPGYVAHDIQLDVRQGVPVTVEKVIALHTSRDFAVSEAGLAASAAVAEADGFAELLERHTLAWDQLWQRFDLPLREDGRADGRAGLILRLHIFHLLQTVSPNSIDIDAGVPARGLHGEAYRGHIFWDELFIFPLLNLRLPILTRSMLNYRFRRLDAARRLARAEGHDGAMYPWQSGSDGREETQVVHLNPKSGRWLPDNSRLQRHINLAVAYNAWSYHQATGDIEFLRFRSGPMILEIARFMAGLASYNRALDRYEIKGVMGPDEYHDGYPDTERPGLDNNAYTNVMTVWLLRRALEIMELLPEQHARELADQLGITTQELDRWDHISRKMLVCFHDGVISQFEGYERLEEFDWTGYQRRYGDIQRLDRILEAEGDTPNRYKLSKQADALMIFYLLSPVEVADLFGRLGYPFDPVADLRRTVDYYLARTSHGSTLSRVVHAWVLGRLDRNRSWELFRQALESDVADVQGGTTHEGVHLGAMAGTVDLVERGYGGIATRDGVLWLDPALPDELPELGFRVHYRGHRVDVSIDRERLRVNVLPALTPAISVGYGDDVVAMSGGDSKEWVL
jgi:alpha,alpha-trehalase